MKIIGTSHRNQSSQELFNNTRLNRLRLSTLKAFYKKKDKKALNLLSTWHTVQIDDKFHVPLGAGQVVMNTDECVINYHLTISNCIGFSPLLPNTSSAHWFMFKMDLKRPYFSFKGKHAMLGFDPAGSMLFIGHCQNKDVFLVMASNEFL